MTTITIEVPDELSEQLAREKARLPELLAQSLQHPRLAAYQYVLDFLASRPTPKQIAAFRPTSEMIERRRALVAREHAGEITAAEKSELDGYDRLEHLVVMMKTGNLPFLVSQL